MSKITRRRLAIVATSALLAPHISMLSASAGVPPGGPARDYLFTCPPEYLLYTADGSVESLQCKCKLLAGDSGGWCPYGDFTPVSFDHNRAP